MDNIKIAGYKVQIIFNKLDENGRYITKDLYVDSYNSVIDNTKDYITNAKISESVYTDNGNPVGVISANTLKLELKSQTKELIPRNESSPYYGFMDSTAIIKVYAVDRYTDTVNHIYLGTYFVSNWTGGTSSDNRYDVKIECTDIIGKILKMQLSYMYLYSGVKLKDFLIDIQNKLNEQLDDRYKFSFRFINDNYKYSIMQWTDIDATNVSDILNTLCQSMMVNIYVDRTITPINSEYNNIICVRDITSDSNIDERDGISDTKDIFYAGINQGSLVGYTGAKVNYVVYNVSESKQLASQKDIVIERDNGEYIVNNVSLGGKCYKINTISLKTNVTDEYSSTGTGIALEDISYNKNSLSMFIRNYSNNNATTNIVITGQTLDETKMFIEKNINNTVNSGVCEVTNRLVGESMIMDFTNDLTSLITNRSNSLIVRGIFKPTITSLYKKMSVECTLSLDISNSFTIVGIDWDLSSDLRCELKMIRSDTNG